MRHHVLDRIAAERRTRLQLPQWRLLIELQVELLGRVCLTTRGTGMVARPERGTCVGRDGDERIHHDRISDRPRHETDDRDRRCAGDPFGEFCLGEIPPEQHDRQEPPGERLTTDERADADDHPDENDPAPRRRRMGEHEQEEYEHPGVERLGHQQVGPEDGPGEDRKHRAAEDRGPTVDDAFDEQHQEHDRDRPHDRVEHLTPERLGPEQPVDARKDRRVRRWPLRRRPSLRRPEPEPLVDRNRVRVVHHRIVQHEPVPIDPQHPSQAKHERRDEAGGVREPAP